MPALAGAVYPMLGVMDKYDKCLTIRRTPRYVANHLMF